MRRKIGIRELKNELTAVIRRVGEERAEYTVTVHGRPVAVIRPLTPSDTAAHADDEVQKELEEMAELARLIGEAGPHPKVHCSCSKKCARSLMAIIDSSIYTASINRHEQLHERSLEWFQQAAAAQIPLLAPAILLAEVAAALSRGQQNTELARRAVAMLRGSKLIHLQPVSISLAESAARIAAEQRIRGCDAVYVAMALQLNQPLVTLDRQQARRSSSIIQVIEP